MVGSTELAAQLGDRRWQALLTAYHGEVRRVLRNNGGREVDNAGDGFFAVFDQPTRAISCACELTDDLHSSGIEVRTGIHMGEVEPVGAKLGGIAVHIGARVVGAANPGEVLVSSTIRDVVTGADFNFDDAGSHALKGVPGEWRLYHVSWPGARPLDDAALQAWESVSVASGRRSSGGPIGLRGEQRVVGRDTELVALSAALESASVGPGGLVLIEGEPGIGKTWLLEELAKEATARGFVALYGRASEIEGAPPYRPWQDVLRALDTNPDLRPGPAGAGLLERAASGQSPSRSTVETPEDRYRLFDAVASELREAAKRIPLLVVLDDLHWADPVSLLLLNHVAGETGTMRLLLVGAHREPEPDSQLAAALPDLARLPHVTRQRLHGLDADATRQQLSVLLDNNIPQGAADRVQRLSDGNPFFVAEIARHLAETRTDVERLTHADWRLLGIPQTTRELFLQRVAGVSPECREALDAACVLGYEVEPELLSLMSARSVPEVLDLLDEARRFGIVETGTRPHDARFRHALVCETLYAELPAASLVQLHGAAASAIERMYKGNIGSRIGEVAHHRLAAAFTADEAVGAARTAVAAGYEAMQRLAYEEASRLYRLALDAAGTHLEEFERAGWLLELARALFLSGELSACFDSCLASAAAARAAGRFDVLGEAALVIDGVNEWRWNTGIAELCDEALARLPEDATGLRARLLAQRTVAQVFGGDAETLDRESRDGLELAERSGDIRAVVAALRARQMLCGPAEGRELLRIGERMLAIGEEEHLPSAILWGHLWRAAALLDLGQVPAARRVIEALGAALQHTSWPLARWHILRAQALMAQVEGRFDVALGLAAQARDAIIRSEHHAATGLYAAFKQDAVDHFQGTSDEDIAAAIDVALRIVRGPEGLLVRMADVHYKMASGHLEDAEASYRQLPAVDDCPMPTSIALPFTVNRAIAAATIGARDDAEQLYRVLLPFRDLFVAGGVFIYAGSVELWLGFVARRLGRFDDAVDHLERALQRHVDDGTIPLRVEAGCELVEALVERGSSGDLARALSLVRTTLPVASSRGMRPFVERLTAAQSSLDSRSAVTVLTRRELEVAGLVARGMTNRDIAKQLFLSERTAQNHVQHILDKLGFSARSQIAAWAATRSSPPRRT
jgi:DNA-binding CsgD family transcriptional regulator/tetratricopeptide (TPR) repeat protein